MIAAATIERVGNWWHATIHFIDRCPIPGIRSGYSTLGKALPTYAAAYDWLLARVAREQAIEDGTHDIEEESNAA